MRIASKTHIGLVRNSNQDAYAASELSSGALWGVVCDGMGGANGGNVAANTAVKIISDQISANFRTSMSSNSIRSMLQSAIFAANAQIFAMSKSVEALAGMGTTVVATVISDGKAHIAHAGDSRAYLIGHEDELSFTQITKDHSIVKKMVDIGELTEQQAKTHPRRNVITRALGAEESIDIDYNEVKLLENDQILICTDGLTNYVSEEEIIDIIKTENFYLYPEKLVELANKNGGGDNITVLFIAE